MSEFIGEKELLEFIKNRGTDGWISYRDELDKIIELLANNGKEKFIAYFLEHITASDDIGEALKYSETSILAAVALNEYVQRTGEECQSLGRVRNKDICSLVLGEILYDEEINKHFGRISLDFIEGVYITTSKEAGKTIKIKDTSELSAEEIEKLGDEVRVVIINDEKTYPSSYTKKEYIAVRKKIDEIIDGIENVADKGVEEQIEAFTEVYKRLSKLMTYNKAAVSDESKYDSYLARTSRDLVGGLMNGTCVCLGYARILHEVLACVGIESTVISGFKYDHQVGHAWNEVKIGGIHFNVDLTNDRNKVVEQGDNLDINTILRTDIEFTEILERYYRDVYGDTKDTMFPISFYRFLPDEQKKVIDEDASREENQEENQEEISDEVLDIMLTYIEHKEYPSIQRGIIGVVLACCDKPNILR